jgi:hypothetical protein
VIGRPLEDLRARGLDIDSALANSCLGDFEPALLDRLCTGAHVPRGC